MKTKDLSKKFADKVFDLASVKLLSPVSEEFSKLDDVSKLEMYDLAWQTLMEIHSLSFDFGCTLRTLDTLMGNDNE